MRKDAVRLIILVPIITRINVANFLFYDIAVTLKDFTSSQNSAFENKDKLIALKEKCPDALRNIIHDFINYQSDLSKKGRGGINVIVPPSWTDTRVMRFKEERAKNTYEALRTITDKLINPNKLLNASPKEIAREQFRKDHPCKDSTPKVVQLSNNTQSNSKKLKL